MSYNEFKNKENNKTASISIMDDEVLMLVCYENNEYIGTIHYPNNSFHYVKDAANNYINGILTNEVVRKYSVEYANQIRKVND